MHNHLLKLRKRFPWAVEGDSFRKDFPLFPTASGAPCSKEAMSATFVQAALRLGVETLSADGSEIVSGHSLRVTGAQGLARLGLDTWAIQLIGRWGRRPPYATSGSSPLSGPWLGRLRLPGDGSYRRLWRRRQPRA